MSEEATRKLMELRINQNDRVNKNRINKTFKVHDIVFVLDRTYVEGNPRVLRTVINPSPYVVLRPLFKLSLAMRIADCFTTLYNNDDLKLFHGDSPLFQNLPPEVLRFLLYKFQDFMDTEFAAITKYDKLGMPSSIQLFDSNGQQEKTSTNEPDLFGDVINEIDISEPTNESKIDKIVNAAPLEEQVYPDFPEDDELEDDIEDLLKDDNVNKAQLNTDDEESSDDNMRIEEPGMKLRSGNISQRKVRFQ